MRQPPSSPGFDAMREITLGLLELQRRHILRAWIDAEKVYVSPYTEFGDYDQRERITIATALRIVAQGQLDPPSAWTQYVWRRKKRTPKPQAGLS